MIDLKGDKMGLNIQKCFKKNLKFLNTEWTQCHFSNSYDLKNFLIFYCLIFKSVSQVFIQYNIYSSSGYLNVLKFKYP